MSHGLGRNAPTDWRHVEKYPFRLTSTPLSVERVLSLPRTMRSHYNQGQEGACVGFACSWMMSTLNRRRYDAFWLYNQAKLIDEWPGESYDGTSIRAGLDVLRDVGHKPILFSRQSVPTLEHGISANRWATSVDDVRGAVALGTPVVLGCNWYTSFDAPERRWPNRAWIGPNTDWGRVRGGHAVCIFGASDKNDAVCFTNSWGRAYPATTWIPYRSLERLLNENGEAALITDR